MATHAWEREVLNHSAWYFVERHSKHNEQHTPSKTHRAEV
jgi:hypothetical protein